VTSTRLSRPGSYVEERQHHVVHVHLEGTSNKDKIRQSRQIHWEQKLSIVNKTVP
jgi:hypothetical protein